MAAFLTAAPYLRPHLSRHALPSRARTTQHRRLCFARPVRTRVSAPRAMAGAPGSGGGGGGGSEAPDGMTLSEALELSFRTVWIQLFMGGVGPAYNEAIIGFVVAAMSAYKAGYSLPALKFELAANETNDKRMEQGRQSLALSDQEKETRLIWIVLVYLTLQSCGFDSDRPVASVREQVAGSSLEPLFDGLSALVDSIRKAERRGFTLETFKMELNVTQRTAENKDGDAKDAEGVEEGKEEGADADPVGGVQSSIRSQWSRIVFSALRIIPETKKGPRA